MQENFLKLYEKKLNKKKLFRVGKVIKRKGDKLYAKCKVMIILLTVSLMKNIQYK